MLKTSLTDLAREIERRQAGKVDYVADSRELETISLNHGVGLRVKTDTSEFGNPLLMSKNARRQLTTRIGIPAKYGDLMAEHAPDLFVQNANHWLGDRKERRMVRTLFGEVRAILSDRYQRIDHDQVAEAVLPVLMETPGLEIVSCEITEKKMYIKATTALVTGEVRKGDIVQAGVSISNSEVGSGAMLVEPFLWRLVCLNGMRINDAKFRKQHVGGRVDTGDELYRLMSAETVASDDKTIMLKTRDVVRAALDSVVFDTCLGRMKRAADDSTKLEGDPVRAIEVLANKVGLADPERGTVLRRLIDGGDLSQWGMANAVTAAAHDTEDYDRATDLQKLGGEVIDLTAQEWEEVKAAA